MEDVRGGGGGGGGSVETEKSVADARGEAREAALSVRASTFVPSSPSPTTLLFPTPLLLFLIHAMSDLPKTYKAVVVKTKQKFEIEDRELVLPKRGEILVKVLACGVSVARSVLIASLVAIG